MSQVQPKIIKRAISHGQLMSDLSAYATAVEQSTGADGLLSPRMPSSPWGPAIADLGMIVSFPPPLQPGPSATGIRSLPAFEIGKRFMTRPSQHAKENAPKPAGKKEPKFPGLDGDFGDYVEWATFYLKLKAKFPGLGASFDEYKKYVRDFLIEQGDGYVTEKLKDFAKDKLADLLSGGMSDALTSAAASSAGGMLDGILGKIEGTLGKIGDYIDDPSKLLDLGIAKGVPMLLGKGMDALFGIDNDDSPGEVVAKQFGRMIAEGMVDALMAGVTDLDSLVGSFENLQSRLKDKIDRLFYGNSGSASLPITRRSDIDYGSDTVTTGLDTVIAEGEPVARVNDLMFPSNKFILVGSAKVLAGGLPVSRRASETATPNFIKTGAAQVLVEGQTRAAVTPDGAMYTPDTSISGSGSGGSCNSGSTPPPAESSNLTQNQETDPNFANQKELPGGQVYDHDAGTVYDPKTGETWKVPDDVQFDESKGQFYQTDGNDIRTFDFERGWSATAAELDKLPDLPESIRDLFRAGESGLSTLGLPVAEGNWYLLGGLIDLGSPEMPGAGTGGYAWMIPDRIGPWDMSDYFVYHDWHYNPDSLLNMPNILSTELASFNRGLKPDPIHAILQMIFSAATTVAGISEATVNSATDLFA